MKKIPKRLKKLKRGLPTARRKHFNLEKEIEWAMQSVDKQKYSKSYIKPKEILPLLAKPKAHGYKYDLLMLLDEFKGGKRLLEAALRHRDKGVRELGVIGLARRGEKRMARGLLKIVQTKGRNDNWVHAINAMVKLPPKTSVPLLARVMQDKGLVWPKRELALEALAKNKLPGAFKAIKPLALAEEKKIKGDASRMKWAAFNGLTELGVAGEAQSLAFFKGLIKHPVYLGLWQRSALTAIKMITKATVDPEIEGKLALAKKKIEASGMQFGRETSILNAIVLMPKIRRACPANEKDRNGIQYLNALIREAKERTMEEVVEALGFPPWPKNPKSSERLQF
jgi:hypothetical protein